jgi:hypothetical protein
MTSVSWFLVTVIGPILLLLFLYWGFWRNRQGDERRDREHSERGARRLRNEIEKDPRYRED